VLITETKFLLLRRTSEHEPNPIQSNHAESILKLRQSFCNMFIYLLGTGQDYFIPGLMEAIGPLVKGATEVAGPLLKGIDKKIHLYGSIS
jgi:hypothetical protein